MRRPTKRRSRSKAKALVLGTIVRKVRRWTSIDPVASAEAAHCRYVDDRSPGIRRRRAGTGFRFVAPDGKPITDPVTKRRIQALVIPPAWTDVWICPSPQGHIQATGRDARGRKQYRYHARFREVREETKYERMIAFASALPVIRRRVDDDLGRPGLDRERVLATVVRLLEITLIRVGNEEYARDNGSFGLTTLRSRHVDVHGSTISFHFRGKSGKNHVVEAHDRRVARIVARCNDLPGETLFHYADESGELRAVEADDVNAYLRAIAQQDFSAKDFRTWAGTVLTACELARQLEDVPTNDAVPRKKHVIECIKRVAERLGNTPAVCRKCYVHPTVFDAYFEGRLASAFERARSAEGARTVGEPQALALSSVETAVLRLLQTKTDPAAALAASVAALETRHHAA